MADLHTIKGWLYGLSTAPDLTDVVADGGVSVGDCYQQEAREFAGRIERIIAALRAQPPARDGDNDRPIEATWTDGKTHAYVNLSAALSAERKAWRQMLGLRIASVRYLDTEAPPAREDAQPVHCHHEAYQGYCAHCGVKVVNGFAMTPKPHPAPDALRDANLWWNAEDWEQTFNSLEDAYDAATGGEMRGVAKLGRATEHDPVWALRIDFDTTGDGETDDYEIRLFRTVGDAYAHLAALQAEQKGGA